MSLMSHSQYNEIDKQKPDPYTYKGAEVQLPSTRYRHIVSGTGLNYHQGNKIQRKK